ncbi:C39 family peptidase [Bacillus sp. 1P02SD]|uniref:C39 family peptidase n=1 Tax=Bacillus sp. 1P02SD TaxID=3132264 RepID=UPI0039A20F23
MNFKLPKKPIVTAATIIIFVFVISGGVFAYDHYNYKQNIAKAEDRLSDLHNELTLIKDQADLLKSDTPGFLKADLTQKEIDEVKSSLNTFKNPKFDFDIKENNLSTKIEKMNTEKESLMIELEEMNHKFSIQEKVNSLFGGEEKAMNGDTVSQNLVIADDLNAEKVIEIKNMVVVDDEAEDVNEWKTTINNLVKEAETQINQIETVTKSLEIYKDGKVAEGVTRKEYNSIKLEVEKVKNQKAKNYLTETLAKIDLHLKEQEEAEIAKAKAEAEKQKREKESITEQKSDKSSAKSNSTSTSSTSKIVELKVPYLNQYLANAPMGCEAAALLQALQYKGYAKNYTLGSFLEEMPVDQEGNPNNGFGGTPYKVVSGVYQSIYPAPLSKWGSKYGSVSNITGSSVENLKKQLDNGNPVIVYVTMNWGSPQYGQYFWGTGIDNAHVMTLSGYKDGYYHVTDPAAGKYWVKASAFEASYNLTKYAVVVY